MSSGTLNMRTSTLWQNTCAISALKKKLQHFVQSVSFCTSDLFFTVSLSLTTQMGVLSVETWWTRWTMITKLISHLFRGWLTAGIRPAQQHNPIFNLGRTCIHPRWPLIALWLRWYTVKLSCTEKWQVKEQEESVVITLHPVQTRGSLVFNEPWASVCTAHESEELWDR